MNTYPLCSKCIYEKNSIIAEPCASCQNKFVETLTKPNFKSKNVGIIFDDKTGEPHLMTNGDRIRNMTDEEIEKWYWWMHKEMMNYTDSHTFFHDWLKREAVE